MGEDLVSGIIFSFNSPGFSEVRKCGNFLKSITLTTAQSDINAFAGPAFHDSENEYQVGMSPLYSRLRKLFLCWLKDSSSIRISFQSEEPILSALVSLGADPSLSHMGLYCHLISDLLESATVSNDDFTLPYYLAMVVSGLYSTECTCGSCGGYLILSDLYIKLIGQSSIRRRENGIKRLGINYLDTKSKSAEWCSSVYYHKLLKITSDNGSASPMELDKVCRMMLDPESFDDSSYHAKFSNYMSPSVTSLTNDCEDLYNKILLSQPSIEYKKKLVQGISEYVKRLKLGRIYPSGSLFQGTFGFDSDMDVIIRTTSRSPGLTRLYAELRNEFDPFWFGSEVDSEFITRPIEFRSRARIPIICLSFPGYDDESWQQPQTSLEELLAAARLVATKREMRQTCSMDISCKMESTFNTKLIAVFTSFHPIVPFAVRIFKSWLKENCVANAINSYTASLMVIFALQHHQPTPLLPNLHHNQMMSCFVIPNIDGTYRMQFWYPGIEGELTWTAELRERVGKIFGIDQKFIDLANDNEVIFEGLTTSELAMSKKLNLGTFILNYICDFYLNQYDEKVNVVDIRCLPSCEDIEKYECDGYWRKHSVLIDHRDCEGGSKCICAVYPKSLRNRDMWCSVSDGIVIVDPIEQGRLICPAPSKWRSLRKRMQAQLNKFPHIYHQ
eukprot:GHVH01000491.1.p1 GENE.GHVH01000491.1~~GHVH01000491.1.p1  ORF type:complete len:672 (-),score=58.58 GHVH01000491.1:1617-3632(-)